MKNVELTQDEWLFLLAAMGVMESMLSGESAKKILSVSENIKKQVLC